MNFVQEFTEQQLSKNSNSHVIEQLQTCHSAVEELICNLQALRSYSKLDMITTKINRFQSYLSTKQQLINLFQSNTQNSIMQWLISNKIQSPLLSIMVKKQENTTRQMLQNIIKRVFLKEEDLAQFIAQNDKIKICLHLFKQIKEELLMNKTPAREKIKNLEELQKSILGKIEIFNSQIQQFNLEITVVVKELEDFQNIILTQFRNFIINR